MHDSDAYASVPDAYVDRDVVDVPLPEPGREYLPGVDELRARRIAAGWSQARVARLLEVSTTCVNHWESGREAISAARARAYAALFEEAGR